MLQRMAAFAVIPDLNPRKTHIRTSSGCLFDFTRRVERVVPVVKTPEICDDCVEVIKRSRGISFLDSLREWFKAAPDLPK